MESNASRVEVWFIEGKTKKYTYKVDFNVLSIDT